MARLSLSTDDQSYNNSKSEQSNTRSEAQKERVSTACTYCRYRKVKCDGGKPSCSFCVHMGRTECVYAKVSEEENQHLRRRKRELRARRAAERLRAEQEKEANSQSPSSSAFNLNTFDLASSSSSSSQSVPKRRRSSVPKRSRERSMASSSITSQSTPNIFSSSAPSQLNQEFPPPEFTLSGLPAELTNTFSSNFLGLLTPQSNTNNAATVESNLNLGVNSYTFPSTSLPINNDTFDVSSSNLGWDFGTSSSSAPAAATSSSSPSMLMNNKRQDQEEHHFHHHHQHDQAQNDQKVPMAPPQSIFALAASNDSFLDSMTGTSGMTIPNFKGPSSFAMPNVRPSNESVQVKPEMEEINLNRFRQESEEISTSPQLSQIEQNDPLFTNIQNQLLQEFNSNSNNNDQTDVFQQQDFNPAKRRFSNFSEEAQTIFSHWPTSPFHPSQAKKSSVPFPNEPSSMPELKRFLCTRNNPFTFNPVTPLAMSVPSNDRFFFNFAASSSSSSTSS